MQKLPKTPEKSGQSPQNNRAQREKISCRAKQDPRKEEQPELSRRAQKIIDEAEQPAKKQGLRKLLRLKKNRKLHQPNSRPKKPPAGAASS